MRLSHIAAARPVTPSSPISRWLPTPARSRPAPHRGSIESPSTTGCSRSKQSWGSLRSTLVFQPDLTRRSPRVSSLTGVTPRSDLHRNEGSGRTVIPHPRTTRFLAAARNDTWSAERTASPDVRCTVGRGRLLDYPGCNDLLHLGDDGLELGQTCLDRSRGGQIDAGFG